MLEFKPIELSDKDIFRALLAADKPKASELTFTNLFMWRCRYRPVWSQHNGCLLIVMRPKEEEPFGLRPVGPGDKKEALKYFTAHLREISLSPRISRACKDFVEGYVDKDGYEIVEDPDNSDYVYLSENLIKLPGNRYHRKKNHLNKFAKSCEFEYHRLDQQMVDACLDLQEDWCELKDCLENSELFEEDLAVYEALKNHSELGFKGAAIVIDSRVEAFALGELLNDDTAVIHIEKANPHIPGLYAAINQMFCEREWTDVKYVNREQDLGVEGLRKAKQSYYPDHMVEKFILIPKD
ncbi:MAG: DUF2156 domain-containing protein [Desulfomonile tiedjei]|uniref:DUF2156 domain-containing protein n=1 Tax=Desulfomonile tiedjei TaxID=2358 RepID=A0A9D6V4W2_9BACT|nr:DUF2156 domain-containing protein [Desulfomonile tiedjei]